MTTTPDSNAPRPLWPHVAALLLASAISVGLGPFVVDAYIRSTDRLWNVAGAAAQSTWRWFPGAPFETMHTGCLVHEQVVDFQGWRELRRDPLRTGASQAIGIYQNVFRFFHVIACLVGLAVVVRWSRPRVLSSDPSSPFFYLRVLPWVMLLSILPSIAIFFSQGLARMYWRQVAYAGIDNPHGSVTVDLSNVSMMGPAAGALLLYALLILWLYRRAAIVLARRSGVILSAGTAGNLGRCLACGYEAGELVPCPECGAKNPRAIPPALYLGRWHMRWALSRWRFLIPSGIALMALSLYTLPLVVGIVRSAL